MDGTRGRKKEGSEKDGGELTIWAQKEPGRPVL